MIIIGITGSIGTGKTTVANLFKLFNINIFNDDIIVNNILSNKRMLKYFTNDFSDAIKCDTLNRYLLRKIVFKDSEKLKVLENIIHPLVNHKRRLFVLKNSLLNSKGIIVFDTPLLFEKNIYKQCTYTIVTYCNKELQKSRVLSRGSINDTEFEYILSKQMVSEEKIKLANFSINTEKSIEELKNEVKNLLNTIKIKNNE